MKRLQFNFGQKIAVATLVVVALAGCLGTGSIPTGDGTTGTGESQGEQVSAGASTGPTIDKHSHAQNIEDSAPDVAVDVGMLRFDRPKVDKLILYSLKCDYDYV